MYTSNSITRKGRVAFALACTFALPGVLGVSAQAQTVHHTWLHRHRKLATVGAGVGAYALAKRRHHGIFHRHPVATGIAAAAIAHHYAKKRP